MKNNEGFSIGDVAKIIGICAKTLRFYDSIHLLSPSFRNETNHYRCYTKDDIITLLIIKNFRTMGFGLMDIQEMINEKDTSTMEKDVRKRMDTIHEQINSLEDQYRMGEDLLVRLHYKKESALEREPSCPPTSDPSQDIRIETIDEIPLLFQREVVHSYKNVDLSLFKWSNIMMEPQNRGLHKKCGAYIVTYYTEPLCQFLMSTCDVEFGVPVEAPADYKNDTNIRTFGGFRAATAVHVGDYSGIINTDVKLLQWINQNGYAVDGPISDEFIISHMDIKNTDEHITKVIVPIRAA